ncbi:hypothetical protein [Granulicoccus sp. GXG6511]|uniref:hypothetical protein n=1 Tax=Granulicoccus sp. GXG6511 TaxID=3381351 RepID=UPI003D7DB2C6
MTDFGVLAALLAGRPDPVEGEAVLDLLRSADSEDLNRFLREVSGPALFAGVDPGTRTELSELLGRRRRDELAPDTLARVVHGLQSQRRTTLRDAVLVEILLSRSGTELTRLKNFINTAEDHQDLEDLVYVDLHEHDRDRVLAHIAAEAQGRVVKDPKVLSDIDDTVFCKLHDRRWPRGMIYPGVLALFEALDIGSDDDPFDMGDLTFVTARPADAWGLVENWSRTALRNAGVSRLSVLSGTLRALVSKEAMATRKMENISHYRRLFPEYELVFLGDSGQGDVIVADRLVGVEGAAVRLVLIHDVVGTPQSVRAAHAARGIHFHDTYVGAAVTAFEHGLISRAGLLEVAREAVGGFERTRWDSVAQRDRMRELFEQDLTRVEEVAG